MQSRSLPVKKKLTLKTLNPYPLHYKTAFAFSRIPYPLNHQQCLTAGLLLSFGEIIGLTLFHTLTNVSDLDAVCPPRVQRSRGFTFDLPSLTLHFLVQACTASLACSR